MEITGIIRGTRGGFSFLIRDDGGEDLLVFAEHLQGAIHGDRVRATVARGHDTDFRPRARVDEILERTHPSFTGDVVRRGRGYFVRPDSPLLPERLPLRPGREALVGGQKILFAVRNTEGRFSEPYALFQETIGESGDARLDPVIIAAEFNLTLRFPDAALAEAEDAARRQEFPEDATRRDFREDLVVTIDPVDAKDFDDAVSVVRLDDGGFELTVHIADVTAYVPEHGPLDREARERGTSVYFPGSVVPMLPEILSSGSASLGPESDKRTLSARILYAPDLTVVTVDLSRGWIRSGARLHYAQALAMVEGDAGAPSAIRSMLTDAAELAGRLREARFAEGGFEFDVPETEMRMGADGVPARLRRKRTLASHHWIEEFMIAANRATGRWALDRDWPYLFRVHEPPGWQALEDFASVALTLQPGQDPRTFDDLARLRRWLRDLSPGPVTQVIHRAFLRAMKKAVYSATDEGHFGLGIEAYCHFTSPIRRYPDLYNHRRIKELLDGAEAEAAAVWPKDIAEETSRTEQNAEAAEREMIRLKTVRYAESHLGREGKGVVTAVTRRGLFVEMVRIPLEGFVPAAGLGRGVHFDPDQMTWADPRSGWFLRPGDAVVVQIVHVDLRLRRLEFRLVSARGRPRSGVPAFAEGATRRRGRPGRPSRGRGKRRGPEPSGRKAGGKKGPRPRKRGRARPGRR